MRYNNINKYICVAIVQFGSSTPVWHRKSVQGTIQVLSKVQISLATFIIIKTELIANRIYSLNGKDEAYG